VPLKFQREGIRYEDLPEDDKDQWDALEWDDDGTVPNRVEAEAVNKWLFNEDTVDKVLAHLMTRGLMVAGGDRLGKTIVFAKNQQHADYIADRFNANYPHYKGEFARVITFKTEYAQTLIDQFSQRDKAPHIAISVDMLDTGIDVPEVVNLVFFKLVRSKTKFWQMVGRGTRLCPNLFGPAQHKRYFQLFDYCQNLEFFSEGPEATEGSSTASLAKRLFVGRLELIGELDRRLEETAPSRVSEPEPAPYGNPRTDADVRKVTADLLQHEVAAMNVDNFIVRPKRRFVEKYARPDAWVHLPIETLGEIGHELAGLPTELDSELEEALRFDLLLLHLQLASLRAEPGFSRLRDRVQAIAALLEEKASIPMVRGQIALIHDVQTDIWWQDATVAMMEVLRKRLRDLVCFIDRKQRAPVYTDFEDEIGIETPILLVGLHEDASFARFRDKARAFLRVHEDHIAVRKLRMNRPLTASDLVELERVLLESGAGNRADIDRARSESSGIGLFVRDLIGMEREAAKEALSAFLSGKTLSASQIEFANLIVDQLTEHGIVRPAALYESPFTDVSPRGPEGLFTEAEVSLLMGTLEDVQARAMAA
jgi:type I restriction enzyme R subunit